jgi:hypothetical protein
MGRGEDVGARGRRTVMGRGEDVGAREGVLSWGEVKALVQGRRRTFKPGVWRLRTFSWASGEPLNGLLTSQGQSM